MSSITVSPENLALPSLEEATITAITAAEYDELLLDEQAAVQAADALMQFEEQYGPEVAEFVGNWCIENNQQAYNVISNISVPLAYLALGATIQRGEVTLVGREIFGRTD